MKHKHHIIPKHAGGTDDPSNLIELTVEDHAESHRLLYEQHGRWEDYYAWQGLSGQIGKEELIRSIQSIANSKPKSEETKKKMSIAKKDTGIGEKNSQYGTCWMTKNGINKKIKKEELINYMNEGWNNGRNLK